MLAGTAEAVDWDGRLVVRTPGGSVPLAAGDVTHVRPGDTRPPRALIAGAVGHPGRVGYPERVLWDDEEVLAHQHPHWSTTARPVVLLLVVVGAGSFGAAAVPAGGDQGVLRLAVVGLGAVVLLLAVVRPLARWVTTSYVVTSERLLVRRGLSARRAAEVDLAQVEAVTVRRSAGQRVLRSGTVLVRCADRSAPLVLLHVPRCDRFQELLDELVDEVLGGDADPAGWWVPGPVTGVPGARGG